MPPEGTHHETWWGHEFYEFLWLRFFGNVLPSYGGKYFISYLCPPLKRNVLMRHKSVIKHYNWKKIAHNCSATKVTILMIYFPLLEEDAGRDSAFNKIAFEGSPFPRRSTTPIPTVATIVILVQRSTSASCTCHQERVTRNNKLRAASVRPNGHRISDN